MPALFRTSRRRKHLASLAAALGLTIITACGSHERFAASSPSPSSASSSAAPGTFRPTDRQRAALRIVPVTTTLFRTEVIADGKIAVDQDRATQVFSPYSGRVTKIIAAPGDIVTRGQALFTLEASEFVQAQNDLLTTASSYSAASSQLALAQTNERRQHRLSEAGAGSLKDWQQSQADLSTAEANERSTRIAREFVRRRLRILGKSDAEIASAERSGDIRAETIVVAPIGGIVTDRQLGMGQYIQSGASTPQYTISDLSAVWLTANVRDTDARMIHLGQAVEIHLPAATEKITARVSYVSPLVDPATHRVAVRATIANPDGGLRPEMFANCTIITSSDAVAIGIPESAVLYEGSEAHVWIARADGSLALRTIRPGRTNGTTLEVLAGLQPGERIVTAGAIFIDHAASSDGETGSGV
jgi:cobalt-zinc-cadmium efflux system membrane fusion protein